MKRLLITGATGFIGSHFVRTALQRDWQITAFCRNGSSFHRLDGIRDKIDWVEMDTDDLRWKSDVFTKGQVDAAIHFATNYGRGKPPVTELLASNLVFPMTLVEGCIAHEVPVFINTDTCFPETYPYLQGYTLSKKQFKRWGELACQGTKTRFLTMELQHPFGPGDGRDKFIPWLIEQCRIQGNIIPLTTGLQKKDFVYVSDVVEAYFCALDRFQVASPSEGTIQIGRGESVSIREMAELTNALCGNVAELRFGAIPGRPGEIEESRASLAVSCEMGWEPKVGLREGILNTINQF